MNKQNYKESLQESLMIDKLSLKEGDVLSLCENEIFNEGFISDSFSSIKNLSTNEIKNKMQKIINFAGLKLKKYKININEVRKFAQQDGKNFVKSLRIENIKDKNKQKEIVLNEAKKRIAKKFNLNKLKESDDEEASSLVIELIFNLLLGSYLGFIIIIGLATPITILIFVWCAVDAIRAAYMLSKKE